jgi:hypothetical protein
MKQGDKEKIGWTMSLAAAVGSALTVQPHCESYSPGLETVRRRRSFYDSSLGTWEGRSRTLNDTQ